MSQFLDYARPYRGEMDRLDVNEVVRRTVPLLPPTGDGAGAPRPEIVLDLHPELPRLRGDAEQLRQVFLNLALNAVQALEGVAAGPGVGKGRLTISTALRRGRPGSPPLIEVRFSDNGPGIAPATQKNLFIPFYTTKEKGTGLGLPISQRIIENHGGHIEVRSRQWGAGASAQGGLLGGCGATFTVVLPVAADLLPGRAELAPGRAGG